MIRVLYQKYACLCFSFMISWSATGTPSDLSFAINFCFGSNKIKWTQGNNSTFFKSTSIFIWIHKAESISRIQLKSFGCFQYTSHFWYIYWPHATMHIDPVEEPFHFFIVSVLKGSIFRIISYKNRLRISGQNFTGFFEITDPE